MLVWSGGAEGVLPAGHLAWGICFMLVGLDLYVSDSEAFFIQEVGCNIYDSFIMTYYNTPEALLLYSKHS
jgi:hypothetical protein